MNGFNDTWRCLICTNQIGVRGILGLFSCFMLTVLALAMPAHVEAKQTTQTYKPSATRATKRVRTTASQTRKPVKKAVSKKASTLKTASVSLPPEGEASPESAAIVERAKAQIGKRYRYGGTTPSGFDCTGLVRYTVGDKANSLPRSAAAMYSSVSKADSLRPGDVVFFGRGRARHAAVYVGNGEVVHASTPRGGVRVDSVHTLARALGFMGVGRI